MADHGGNGATAPPSHAAPRPITAEGASKPFIPGAMPPDNAPRDLDHYKRGHSERADMRSREQIKWDPPGHDGPSRYGPGASSNHNPNNGSNDRFNFRGDAPPRKNDYSGGPPSSSAGRYNHNNSNNQRDRSAPGFSMEDVVDRLCDRRSNAFEEMDRARTASPESFASGRAITAILSQLGRRRQMRVAMQVWRWMEQADGISRNVFHYNALINVCEKAKDWKMALDLMGQMDKEGIPKNEITYSSAISACEKGGNWRGALDLLRAMKERGVVPTAIAYNAAISACEKGLNPGKALELFDEMKRAGVRPTVVTFSALISACEKGQQWKLALQVLEEMKATFGPNVIAYSAAISALSKGQQWEKAWELFVEIEQSGERLSVVTYNATMTALEKGLQWERALDLFDEMKYKNMPVTVVSYGSAISACEKGCQWRQCLEYLDEMTERKIAKNVIIFGAAMSCMEKSCRADIGFQLMERMEVERVRPNVHIYNSVISACARCKLWQKGFELFKEMDRVGVKRDVVTYNAVLDAVCSQVDLAEDIFQEGVQRGFYAKVSRLGGQWFELDLHFLSLGGGETALRWWFEKCLVPYLGDSKELANVKSIDIVTGYGKTRSRGARRGDDSMRKRVRAMLSFMNVRELEQPNLGRIHIDKQALMDEVQRNQGRIIFDAHGYEQFKLQEGLDNSLCGLVRELSTTGGRGTTHRLEDTMAMVRAVALNILKVEMGEGSVPGTMGLDKEATTTMTGATTSISAVEDIRISEAALRPIMVTIILARRLPSAFILVQATTATVDTRAITAIVGTRGPAIGKGGSPIQGLSLHRCIRNLLTIKAIIKEMVEEVAEEIITATEEATMAVAAVEGGILIREAALRLPIKAITMALITAITGVLPDRSGTMVLRLLKTRRRDTTAIAMPPMVLPDRSGTMDTTTEETTDRGISNNQTIEAETTSVWTDQQGRSNLQRVCGVCGGDNQKRTGRRRTPSNVRMWQKQQEYGEMKRYRGLCNLTTERGLCDNNVEERG
ncbi:hypothetical protein ACHAXT_006604 [Thalassiosira profunda]